MLLRFILTVLSLLTLNPLEARPTPGDGRDIDASLITEVRELFPHEGFFLFTNDRLLADLPKASLSIQNQKTGQGIPVFLGFLVTPIPDVLDSEIASTLDLEIALLSLEPRTPVLLKVPFCALIAHTGMSYRASSRTMALRLKHSLDRFMTTQLSSEHYATALADYVSARTTLALASERLHESHPTFYYLRSADPESLDQAFNLVQTEKAFLIGSQNARDAAIKTYPQILKSPVISLLQDQTENTLTDPVASSPSLSFNSPAIPSTHRSPPPFSAVHEDLKESCSELCFGCILQ